MKNHSSQPEGAGTDLRPEDAVTSIAVSMPEAAGPDTGFWGRLQGLADTRAIPRTFKAGSGVSLLPLAAYLPLALDALREAADARHDGDWRTGLDLPRAKDLEQNVFPRLAFALRRAAAEGEDSTDLLLVVMEYLVRELLRAGRAPVMYQIPVRQDPVN